jgi:hypothetical protein
LHIRAGWGNDVIVEVGHFGLGCIVGRYTVILVEIGNVQLQFATQYVRSAVAERTN